ncbi:Protein ABHD11 [Bagarius yarrelli]|uniref:sn-1-specific diacylglycerol lipase ABHD11 n=1 Tax=Bagarius yarrelli TaxID=175774 RepID=A0A556TX07_BAGYA|nr:Protein ABHD11 [Bagarius yarrelli]
MSLLRRMLTRGLLPGQLQRPPVAGARCLCSSVTRLDGAQQDSAATSTSPVNLSYDVFDGKDDAVPLVFLHGLFGSKSNFHTIAKSLVQRTGRKGRNCTLSSQVLTVDARNHGSSAHSPMLTYEAMTNDLKHLLNQLHIGKCVLIGHSMGGKTAMATALSQPSLVERLMVVDISPAPSADRTLPMKDYINAMKEVNIPSNIPRSSARRVAENQLRDHVKLESVRRFLLTNLVEHEGHYSWRINLEAILNHLPDLMGFPQFDTPYEGPTLFLGGSNSEYISSEDYPEIQRLFPYGDVLYIPDASHWVHADKPLDFISTVITFIQS